MIRKLAFYSTILLASLTLSNVNASPVFSNSPVVSSATNTATFDSLIDYTGPNLSTYAEDGINVSLNDISHYGTSFFTGATGGFHYGSSGNNSWVTISMVNGSLITGLDFIIGDGWSPTGTTNLIWETFIGAVSTGFGDVVINKDSVVGWTDISGFTSIRVAANEANIDSFGEYQAIALDNLRIGASGASNGEIPVPAPLALLGLGLLAIGYTRKRKA